MNFSKMLRTFAVIAVMTLPLTNTGIRAAVQDAVSGIDPANLDRTCRPCQDFFQFANGGWIARHPLPAAHPSYGAFTVLALHNQDVLREILEHAATANAPVGSNEQKIGDFYASCMDEKSIEANGLTALNPTFALVDKVTDVQELAPVLAQLDINGVSGFFEFGSSTDLKNSTMEIGAIHQGGLTLPTRDYYLATDATSQKLRDAYTAYVTKMFGLLGEDATQAASDTATVMAIETTLAKASLSPADARQPERLYHKMNVAALTKLAPNFNWTEYFSTFGLARNTFNVAVPAFVRAFSDHVTQWTPAQIRTYLRWRALQSYDAALPRPFELANFDFFSRTLEGSKEELPRWERCVRYADGALGEALGAVYVAQVFPPEAKSQVLEMVQTIKTTLRDDMTMLPWMSAATRAKAIAKLDAFTLKIGYPDTWRDYSALPISRGSFSANVIAASEFDTKRDLAKIGKPVDRHEWGMTPPTVNAYYSPSGNEIVFPAGILQPPFFNPHADPAINYGAIGAVIGHESTHGFDDYGRKFDAQGNLSNWWTAADAANFDKRKQCVIDQFNALEPVPGVHENGRLITGEAIADLGGVTIAYKAFERWQATHPRKIIDGFTPEQRFFLGFASVWASVESPQYTRFQASTDPHPYDKFRVNATLSNLPEFAQAWNCPIGPMARPVAQQCRIW